jgi:hypothetical protein
MTPGFEDSLWTHLVDAHGADRARPALLSAAPSRGSRRRPLVVSAGVLGLASVAAAVTLVVGATSTTPPAYALTPNANGSYTLTINDAMAAIPRVNARLAQLGINDRVIPVTPDCTAPDTAGIPLIDFGNADTNESITVDNANIPSGTTGFIAVDEVSPGDVEMGIGTTFNGPLPACLNSHMAPGTGYPRP